jgi:hypothetical protein
MADDPIKRVATPVHDGPSEYEGGSQPVRDSPPEVPDPGGSVMQVIVLVVAALVLLGALVWLVR